jgi:dihydrofolate synthase/folylpolyglutamate synthase
MNYALAVEQLLALGHELHRTPSHKFDLDNMRVLLRALSHPERRFQSVLIAGTNGKGSTAATLAAITQAAGIRTGLYTSPHLIRVNERLRINGEEISDPEFAEIYDRIEPHSQRLVAAGELPWHPSFFETLTAMAFEYFASSGIELAILEVGMGGRLDATNVVHPAIAVICDIDLDHQKFLGNTIAEIAREKAGIIRRNGGVVTLPQHPQANDVIGHAILDANARGVNATRYMPPVSPGVARETGSEPGTGTRNRYPLEVMGQEITVDSPLVGRHQLRNIALAIAAADELNAFGFRITASDVEHGIRATNWQGRFQRIPACNHHPEIVLDVAHNPAGAWALRSALSQNHPERPFVLVFAAMRDKAIGEMADILFPLAAHIIATVPDNPRAATCQEIRAASRVPADILCEPDPAKALPRACELAGHEGLVVITGSIYLVGSALQWLE